MRGILGERFQGQAAAGGPQPSRICRSGREGAGWGEGAASSATLLEQKQARAHFYALVGRMNRKWRETFVLFEVVGHSGEEIAALTGLPHATVRTHLHRARKEFLALLAEEPGGAP